MAGRLLQQVYHHVALPRNVPGSEEKNLHAIEAEILHRLLGSAKVFSQSVSPGRHHMAVDAVRLALTTAKTLNVDGKIDKHALVKELSQLNSEQALILHVTEQNAALLIYRDSSNPDTPCAVFEAFETSATCEKVLAAKCALDWSFPGVAASVPWEVVSNASFQESLTVFLEQSSIESIKQFSAVTHKAAAPLPEIRDTVQPVIITGLLMTILEASGQPCHPNLLRKRVRDTVSFKDAHKPWRRSAFYLALRVCMQRHLYKMLGPDIGRLYYKALMCIFVSNLLEDMISFVPHEASHVLRLKLGRRLSKLEVDRERATMEVRNAHDDLFRGLCGPFEKILSSAAQYLDNEWKVHQNRSKRIIRPVPPYADTSDLHLQFCRSRPYLQEILHQRLNQSLSQIQTSADLLLERYETSNAQMNPFATIAGQFISLAEFEEEYVDAACQGLGLEDDAAHRCAQLSGKIESYITAIGKAYSAYGDFMSKALLKTFELWVELDRTCVSIYPLLADFHPAFEANMLDTIQLHSLSEMERLQAVQCYISGRCHGWTGQGTKTIFDSPAADSFSSRYYEESDDSQQLLELRALIENDAEEARAAKEEEWKELSQDHSELLRDISEASCAYETVYDDGHLVEVHKRGCRKHMLKWKAKHLKIKIHEHPLPQAESAARAALFELRCPWAFASYRDATWQILKTFSYPFKDPIGRVPVVRRYSGLVAYGNNLSMKVTLGSKTKSHLDSHYATSSFPVSFEAINRPCGLRLDYFDEGSCTWTSRGEDPSFSTFFTLNLPFESSYRSLQASSWPSSNRIVASQTRCPPDVNVHEFLAWQNLLVGTHARWLSLLRELGSTNLNFSTDSTWAVVSRLMSHVGPNSSHDPLRDIHAVFHDRTFCTKLLEQITSRLRAIQRNWREPVIMDIMISILFKIRSLSSISTARLGATRLLEQAQHITWSWNVRLQSADKHPVQGTSVFAIWSSLLCKRTLYAKLESETCLDNEALRYFISSSIALSNSVFGSFKILPYNLRNALLQDIVFVHSVRHKLQAALTANVRVFLQALNEIWPVPAECVQPELTFIDRSSSWVEMTLTPTQHSIPCYVHYNIVHGTLLINGQELGTLPPKYHEWPEIEELLGQQNIRYLPSPMFGMSLVATHALPNGHWVHLGFREDNRLIIRASQGNRILELVRKSVFGTVQNCDLPNSLMANCFHWLDITTGIMEVRQENPWKTKDGNWSIDIPQSRATRRNSTLVDPNSKLFKTIAQNFAVFEYAHYITVFQPRFGRLRVELRRLDLDFEVTKSKKLYCSQLDAVIPETKLQDIGTWYGLHSKIVIQSVKNVSQLSVLVPIGDIVHTQSGAHVGVVVKNDGNYVKFSVNEILGRLECPADPRLLYTKALWHATTSHFLPDPLTGRTGTEEALYYLQSGSYQPWTSLPEDVVDILIYIAELTPLHAYYPADLKCMETISWNPYFPVTIQDDRLRRAVEKICHRLFDVSLFAPIYGAYSSSPCPSGNLHLEDRALAMSYNQGFMTNETKIYQSRDRRTVSEECQNAACVSAVIWQPPKKLENTAHLVQILQQFPLIGGHDRKFDQFKQLTDLISLNLATEWGALVQTCLTAGTDDKFRLMFLLATLAFSSDAPMDLIHVLVSYTIFVDLKELQPPLYSSYVQFKHMVVPQVGVLAEIMKGAQVPYIPDKQMGEVHSGQLAFARSKHAQRSSQSCELLAQSLMSQWPNQELKVDLLAEIPPTLLDRAKALDLVMSEWTWFTQNYEYSQYLNQVQPILDRYSIRGLDSVLPQRGNNAGREAQSADQPLQTYSTRFRGGESPSLPELLQKSLPLMTTHPNVFTKDVSILKVLPNGVTQSPKDTVPLPSHSSVQTTEKINVPAHVQELSRIVALYTCSTSSIQKRYGNELQESIGKLIVRLAVPEPPLSPFNPTFLENQIFKSRETIKEIIQHIRFGLQQRDGRARWLRHAGWPRLTPVSLLTELRSTSGIEYGSGVKQALVSLGLRVTDHQRLLRIRDAVNSGRQQQLTEEMANEGHQNWSAMDHSDWLLLEIDSNILLRPEQVEVALATISPQSGQNSVLQLLMGKGKTSCIMPMVALVLADKHNLFRIVVPRPLLLQSAQIMQAKLGGLLNRDVLHVPFSRGTKVSVNLMQTYCNLHTQLRKESGILLALPEHILSFKLSGLQQLCDGNVKQASIMIKAQDWLEKYSRDVLDESDVSLAIRTQLIYPSGSQMTVDGHPHRWQTIEAILRLIRSYLYILDLPQSIEVAERSHDGYPFIYFLRIDAEERLVAHIVREICKGQTTIMPCAEMSDVDQKALESFISLPHVAKEAVERVTVLFEDKLYLLNVVYLLRGLIVHRILLSTLKKRWNVQYGFHPERDPIAVPYVAKGVPSPSAEFGHPDVAITLTCLSFYYQGLSILQFKQAFEQLLKTNEPSIEFEKWATKAVPEGLRDCNSINIEDSAQLRELHFYVRFNPFTIDFYMNCFVFPRHAKQFKTKLQASGWDLVLYEPGGSSNCKTTGFSGTNDTRHQLPMTIKQNDLPQLQHTNAEVLAYLLEDRNRGYVRAVDINGKRWTEEGLLHNLHRQRIRVLIDAGAQILEHDNAGFAKSWLAIDYEAAAIVYFASDHKPWILHRKGRRVPLVASTFADSLDDSCLVYFDESHCRGTDLKLSSAAKAVLTLGPNLTKDALVQAAMRLRLLGQTQSVTFVSPPEVHQTIMDLRKTRTTRRVDSSDVIRWLLEQSCNAIEQLEPLHIAQGTDYLQRTQAKLNNPNFLLLEGQHREQYLSALLCQETTTLKELYQPKHLKKNKETQISFAASLSPFSRELRQRRAEFQDRGFAIHSSALEEVEQEREVENEVENVREVQIPVHFNPLKFPNLHEDIEGFARLGRLPERSNAFESMFTVLKKTALAKSHAVFHDSNTSRPSGLFISTQFSRTVKLTEPNDNFLRDPQWLLWSCRAEVGLVISPEEADLLIPILRRQSSGVHLIVYAAPVTRKMLHFNNLDYYAVPPLPRLFSIPEWLKVELGIFAGRLYFGWKEYAAILDYISPNNEAFSKSPLTFLHDFIALRRRGQDFEFTPMGFITTGKPLFAEHPFFLSLAATDGINPEAKAWEPSAVQEKDDETEDEEEYEELLGAEHGDDDGEEYVEDDDDESNNVFYQGFEYLEETENEE